MLSRRDRLYLRKFLTLAYAEMGRPEPERQARMTVRALTSADTLPQAISEFVRPCERMEQRGGVMSLRAEAARDILAHHISHTSYRQAPPAGAAAEGLGLPDEEFWQTYRRRYQECAGEAAREAACLRLLDRCDPTILFSFYLLPDEGTD